MLTRTSLGGRCHLLITLIKEFIPVVCGSHFFESATANIVHFLTDALFSKKEGGQPQCHTF
jgi:hypothetical protein